jgi:hypothetical protein
VGLQPPAPCLRLSAVPSEPEEATSDAVVISLWMSIEPGEPPKGIVGDAGGGEGTPFCGWIDFMTVINTFRSQPPPG